jgi:hypothetical protein
MSTTTLSLTFTHLTCCYAECGLTFAAPESWVTCRRNDHAWFYCPNGHVQQFSGKSEAEKLRAELADAERAKKYWVDRTSEERGRVMERERTIRTMKGHTTRLKKRVAAGVCPCCKRTFQDLAHHMHGQHPTYSEEP